MIGSIKTHIGKDHLFTGLNQISKSLYGLLTIALVPMFLSKEEQGYWFTFTSVAALSMLADLGFSNIILQFAAHEFAYLSFDDNLYLTGSEKHLKKLASFFIFSLKWVSSVILMAFPVILGIGFYLLGQKKTTIQWWGPWVLYTLASAFAFFLSTVLYFFEGCNAVGRVQKIRMTVYIIMALSMLLALSFRLGLFALPFSLLISSAAGLLFLAARFNRTISKFTVQAKSFTYPWMGEFLPLLLKYAISWSSGYFIFQIYTPLMFYYNGPIEAGRVGISITLWMGIFSLANVWIYVITPKLNMLVAKRDWVGLDQLFFRNLFLSGFTFLAGMASIMLIINLFKDKIPFINRLADIHSIYLLGIGWFFQIIVNGIAVYLRAHKEEPLVIPSLVSSIYIVAATFLCAKYLDPMYFFLGYVSHYFWGIPWLLHIFRSKRRSHLLENTI